jgi:hypothetical protein
MRAKANHRRLKRANSCARKWNIYVKANMAPARLNKRLPSVCPKRVGPASSCRRPEKAGHRGGLGNRLSATWRRAVVVVPGRRLDVRAPPGRRLNGNVAEPRPIERSPGRPILQRADAARPTARVPPRKLLEPGKEGVRQWHQQNSGPLPGGTSKKLRRLPNESEQSRISRRRPAQLWASRPPKSRGRSGDNPDSGRTELALNGTESAIGRPLVRRQASRPFDFVQDRLCFPSRSHGYVPRAITIRLSLITTR